MPEIIEAEITKQKLKSAIQGKRILDFWTDNSGNLISEKKNLRRTISALKGRRIKDLERFGKMVVINLDDGNMLAIHQRMSGHIVVEKREVQKLPSAHAHFSVELEDGINFMLHDPRKFGEVWYGSRKWFEKLPFIKNLGHDAMVLEDKILANLLKNTSSGLKGFLLRQDKIAGLGNVTVDEVLWRARLNPKKKTDTLTLKEIKNLHKAIYVTLASILRHGGISMRDWRHPDGQKGKYQNYFMVYNREKCRRCRNKIIKQKISGRGTYFCKICQKMI